MKILIYLILLSALTCFLIALCSLLLFLLEDIRRARRVNKPLSKEEWRDS
jgi:hypothetical protein